MKKIFNTNTNSTSTDIALLTGRVAIAALMLGHGLPKLIMLFSGDPIQFPSVMGMSGEFLLTLAVFSEVLCSIFILAGFVTRLAVVPLIITMLVIVFSIHAKDVFAKKELGILYLVVYVILLFAGSGKFSFDYWFQRKPKKSYHPESKPDDPTIYIYQ